MDRGQTDERRSYAWKSFRGSSITQINHASTALHSRRKESSHHGLRRPKACRDPVLLDYTVIWSRWMGDWLHTRRLCRRILRMARWSHFISNCKSKSDNVFYFFQSYSQFTLFPLVCRFVFQTGHFTINIRSSGWIQCQTGDKVVQQNRFVWVGACCCECTLVFS